MAGGSAGVTRVFNSPARRSIDEAELDEIRFVDLFYGVGLFIDRSGNGIHADWAARIFFEQREHDLLVDFVQTEAIHLQQVQSAGGRPQVDVSFSPNLCVIPDAPQ